MNKLIITGHGEYAEGLLSSLKMLSSNIENIIAINFTKEDTEETLLQKYNAIIGDDNYVFICDLLGGTPYKIAAKVAYGKENIKVVTGANLGGILDSNFKINKLSLLELTENLIEASKKNLMILNLEQKEESNNGGI